MVATIYSSSARTPATAPGKVWLRFLGCSGGYGYNFTALAPIGEPPVKLERIASTSRTIAFLSAVATLDPGLPQNSMYLVWAENAAGASLPFAVNKTQAQWVGPNAASTGATVSIYGQNLSYGASTPQSWIYLQPAQGQGRWITPTSS